MVTGGRQGNLAGANLSEGVGTVTAAPLRPQHSDGGGRRLISVMVVSTVWRWTSCCRRRAGSARRGAANGDILHFRRRVQVPARRQAGVDQALGSNPASTPWKASVSGRSKATTSSAFPPVRASRSHGALDALAEPNTQAAPSSPSSQSSFACTGAQSGRVLTSTSSGSRARAFRSKAIRPDVPTTRASPAPKRSASSARSLPSRCVDPV